MTAQNKSSVISTRTDLLQALCDAAQLEQALCCAYLFAALSIKRRSDEGVPQVRLADLRNWESVLLLIARQEMDHLGIVCNLLTAIGGMPYLQNPSFPVHADRYGDLPDIHLQRFSKNTLENLLKFETPEWIHLGEVIHKRVQDAASYGEALSMVLETICAEMEWITGDIWVPKEETFVPLLRTEGGLELSYAPEVGKEIWTRWQTPHPPLAAEFTAKQNLNSDVANTYIEIPIYRGLELKFVWRFFYETFRDFNEDDALANSIEILLSGLDFIFDPDQWPDTNDGPPPPDIGIGEKHLRYSTVGGFYRQIRKGFLRLCFKNQKPTGDGLFTGFQTSTLDIGIADRNVHDMYLPTVSNLDSALSGIEQIIETGEATFKKREDSHYTRLTILLKEAEAVLDQPGSFDPARATVDNPVVTAKPGCTLLDHPDAVAVAEIFDATYGITLQMLARYFAFPDDKVLQGMAFGPLMTMALRPLAEILGELPADQNSDRKAGPPFQDASRDLLHPHRIAAWTVYGERLQEIAGACAAAEANLQPENRQAGQRLTFIAENLNFIASRLKTAVAQAKTAQPSAGAAN